MNFNYIYLNLVLWIFTISGIQAQTQFDKNTFLPMDESIRYGKLPNGFTYYLKPLSKPQPKLYMKLLHKAGGNQEDFDQLNIPHAIEHLTFRATEHFPNGVSNDKETMGKLKMDRVRDFTGGNSSYFTVYGFNAPPHNASALKTGLIWFKDIIQGLSLKKEDIDKERGALKQEFISKESNNYQEFFTKTRLYSKLYPCKLSWDNFLEYNENFSSKVLRRFYNDWYRPDLMGLVIVGNINNLDSLENQVKNTFSSIPVTKNPRKWRDYDSLYYHQKPRFAIIEKRSDESRALAKEKVEIYLNFHDSKTRDQLTSAEGIERKLSWQIITDVLNKRLNVFAETYNPSFTAYSKYLTAYESGLPFALNIVLTAEQGHEKMGLRNLFHKLHQLQEYGVKSAEWEATKKKWLRYITETPTDGSYVANEISKHFIVGEAFPKNKQELLGQWLKNLSFKNFNILLKKLISSMPQDIGILAPKESRAIALTEKEVRNEIKKAWKLSVEPYQVSEIPKQIINEIKLSKLPEKGLSERESIKKGIKEFRLHNGIKVVFMENKGSSSSAKGKIKIHGFSPNGAACFSSKDYFSAINSPFIVKNSGVASWDKFQIRRFLSQTSLFNGVMPYVNFRESGIRGEGGTEDATLMLKLIYLYFSQPRESQKAFLDWKRRKRIEYRTPPYDVVAFDFQNDIKEIIGDKSYNNVGEKLRKGLSKTKQEKVYSIYKHLFGNASEFTFVISGDFEIDSLLPAVQKFLGNLPQRENSLKCNSSFISEKEKQDELKKLPDPGYELKNIQYALKFIPGTKEELDWKKRIKVKLLGAITKDVMWSLRFDKGYSLYTLLGSGKYNQELQRYIITLKLAGDSQEFEILRKEMKQLVSKIKQGEISDKLFQQNLEKIEKGWSLAFEANSLSLRNLEEHYKYGLPLIDKPTLVNYLNSITKEDIVEIAQMYYNEENQYEFVMGLQ